MEDSLSIVSRLIQVLESTNESDEVDFGELCKKSTLSLEIVEKYLRLIAHIQRFAPLIKITENNKTKILKKLSNGNLTPHENVLLMLLHSTALRENTARFKSAGIFDDLINNGLVGRTNDSQFYLTENGKRTAFRIYRRKMDTIYQNYYG